MRLPPHPLARQRGEDLARAAASRSRYPGRARGQNRRAGGVARGQREMSGLVQDDIGLGRAIERPAVPIERAFDPVEDGPPCPGCELGKVLPADAARPPPRRRDRRGRADPAKHRARERVLEVGHEAVETSSSCSRGMAVKIINGMWDMASAMPRGDCGRRRACSARCGLTKRPGPSPRVSRSAGRFGPCPPN